MFNFLDDYVMAMFLTERILGFYTYLRGVFSAFSTSLLSFVFFLITQANDLSGCKFTSLWGMIDRN